MEGTAAVGCLTVQCTVAESNLRMLCHGDIDYLRLSAFVEKHALRPLKIHPRPAVAFCGFIGPLRGADGKECAHFRRAFVRQTNDHRLAVQIKPGIRAEVGAVNRVINVLNRFSGSGVGIKHDLRRVKPGKARFMEQADQQLGILFIDGGVGGVKNEKIDAGTRQHLHMAPHDPCIAGMVIPVERFSPVVVDGIAAPNIRIRTVSGLWVACKQLCNVQGSPHQRK